ncbi:MAG: hypothetical protein SFU83_08235 [Meiothermus sp.]|nr:hypothetical protein [Meiothermus sp.]
MTRVSAHPQLRGLNQRLERGRTRLQLVRFGRGLSWGILLSAAVWLVFSSLRWAGGMQPGAWAGLVPLYVLAVWALGVALYILRTPPSLMHIAQRAEKHYGLEERLSTALEVVHRPPRDTAHAYIYEALVRDAAAKSERVKPGQLFEFRPPRNLLYALGIGALALGLQFAPKLAPPQAPVQTAGLSPQERASTVTQLERVTQLVRRDAERTNDPYLQATVRSLEQLKAQIRSGQLAGPQAQQEIARLSEQIERGYSLPGPSPSSQPATSNSPAVIADNPSRNAPQTGSNRPQGDQPGQQNPNAQQQTGTSPSQQLNNLAQKLEAKPQQAQDKSPAPPQQTQSQQQGECDGAACSDIYAKARSQQTKDAESATRNINRPPGGAAGGFGDQAGKEGGGKSGARGGTPPPRTRAEQVKLPFQAPPSGRRIQILGPASASTAANVTGTVEAQNWVRQEEVPIGLGYLAAPNRSIVSSYFTPAKETQ